MKLIKLWDRIGKQPLKVSNHKDVIVEVDNDKYLVTGIHYENGQWIALIAERIK